jgi:hypothetical protein
MGGDHQSPDGLNLIPQVLDGHDPLDIPVITENQDVPLIGGDLVALENADFPFAEETFHFLGGPPILVLRKADSVQPRPSGGPQERRGIDGAAGGFGAGVDVQVDSHPFIL